MPAKTAGKIIAASLILVWTFSSGKLSGLTESGEPAAHSTTTLLSQFTDTAIQIDGKAEAVWKRATPSRIGIAMNADLSTTAP